MTFAPRLACSSAFAAALCLFGTAALADAPAAGGDCHIASLDMRTEVSGLVTVPVTIDGVDGRWMVDTGNAISMISSTLVAKLKLKREPLVNMGVMMGGVPIYESVQVHSLALGPIRSRDSTLSVAPEPILEDDTIGMLAPDIMRNYDIEFDFAGGKFNILSPDHCPGQVAYWTRGAYTRIPMTLDSAGHITIPVVLDGKTLKAVVDTGAQGSAMSLSLVEQLYGLDEHDPRLQSLGKSTINGLAETLIYRYPFHSLTFEGVQIADPDIAIFKDTGLGNEAPELLLGIETLRRLHLYIAYKEGALYLTPAEAR